MAQIQPVILCGGSGTRLCPLSRSGFPKQFLCLTGSDSLFQQAAKRLSVLVEQGDEVSEPIIICHEDHRFLAQEQLREVGIGLGAALLEPVGRNTAPALTLAALRATEHGKDPILVVTPADQTVTDPEALLAKTALTLPSFCWKRATSSTVSSAGPVLSTPNGWTTFIKTRMSTTPTSSCTTVI